MAFAAVALQQQPQRQIPPAPLLQRGDIKRLGGWGCLDQWGNERHDGCDIKRLDQWGIERLGGGGIEHLGERRSERPSARGMQRLDSLTATDDCPLCKRGSTPAQQAAGGFEARDRSVRSDIHPATNFHRRRIS